MSGNRDLINYSYLFQLICTAGMLLNFVLGFGLVFDKLVFDVDDDEKDDIGDGDIAVDVLEGVVDPELELVNGG